MVGPTCAGGVDAPPGVPKPLTATPHRWLVALLFATSGATSLGFELVWAKQLAVVLGGSTASIAFVVAVFMGGMALGYAVGARVAPRVRRPVAVYGACELGLALAGLAAAQVLPVLGALSLGSAYLAATLVLLPCTMLAGVTLPLLVAATQGSLGVALGRLYACNTLGAVVGVLATGFGLIGAFGLHGTALRLAVVGATVGSVALFLGRVEVPQQPVAHDQPVLARWWMLAAAVGLCSLAEEVLWTRALVAQFNASTYALAAILAVYLLGLALGAWAAGRWMQRGLSAVTLLIATQALVAVVVPLTPHAMVWAETWMAGYVGVRHQNTLAAWLAATSLGLARTAIALLLPTFLLGCALPALAELAAPLKSARAAVAGLIAGSNTVGAVIGALGARFVLLPALGCSGSLRLLAVIHALVAALAVLGSGLPKRRLLAAAAAGALALAWPLADPLVGRLARGQTFLLVDEGVQDTTAVVQMPGPPPFRQIIANGIAYAGDAPSAQRYMRLLGHLPALHAREQTRALVVCVGTGMTAAAVARHSDFARVDLVDISPVVYQTLPLFARANDDLLHQPRVHIAIEDGRVWLNQVAAQTYDVIALEPPPPRVAGVAALYSQQFYLAAKRALRDGGAIAQWLPVHGMTGDELKMLARTFLAVFPDGALLEIQHNEAALLATAGQSAAVAEQVRRAALPHIAGQLAAVGVADARKLPQVHGMALRQALGPGPIVTDDDPRIEQFAAGLADTATSTDAAGQLFLDAMLGARRAGD